PGLHHNPNYPTWLHDAETHLQLIHHLKDQTHLQRGDRKRIGQELGITRQKFTAWAQDARKPRLYYELDRMLSKTQAQATITQIHEANNGLHSTEDVSDRLQSYFLTPLLEQSKQHTKRLHQCTLYFQAVDLLKDGGAYLDAARHLDIHHSQIMHWLDGSRPDYIELTRHIPQQQLEPHWKWLPLTLERAFIPTHLITVPDQVTHHTQINNVLDQLTPLDNDAMQHWETRFGPPNPEDAFYYLLGLIVSDYDKQRPRISSTELILNLSKNYSWSEQVGEAASYYLGQLGIHSKEGKPHDSSAGKGMCHKWRTQKSPLLTWIIQTVLGLQPYQRTTYYPIQANWILNAPKELKIAFLQGLNDGDGCASVKDQCLSNTCGPNISFVQKLLASFDITSSHDEYKVRIYSLNGIIHATDLPFFRHATQRQSNAQKLAQMAKIRQNQPNGINSPEVLDRMIELHDMGCSMGRIAEILFDEFDVSFDSSTVRRRLEALDEIDYK
ncbi:MAG: LAGLIDADG family homing endonuclease, partial [Promethearchaeota archaeon]